MAASLVKGAIWVLVGFWVKLYPIQILEWPR